MSLVFHQSYWKLFKSLEFSDKALTFLYFFALVPCSVKLLMGINTRIGLDFFNPILDTLLLVILSLLGFRSFIKELKWWDIIVVLGIAWFVFWSPYIYPQTTLAVLEFGPYFVINCLPFYLVGASIHITRHEYLFGFIGRYGLLVNILICILALLGFAQKLVAEGNNMELAYGLLPSLIFVTRDVFKNYNKTDFSLALIGSFLILALGCRGAFLAFAFFVVGEMILFKHYNYFLLSRLVILLGAGICFLLLNPILLVMKYFTSSVGLETRVYDAILEGEIVSTDSRDWIYEEVGNYILSDKGHIGYGLFYDRVLMGMERSSYAHNIIYELLLDFGVYLGSFLLIFFTSLFFINMIKAKGTSSCSMIFAFFCSCVICLFFSSSYLCNSIFWIFVGLMISTFRKTRHQLAGQF